MGQVQINKLVVLGDLTLKDDVLRLLAREGNFQITSIEEVTGDSTSGVVPAGDTEPAAPVLPRLREAIRYLENISTKKKSFLESLAGGPLPLSEEDFLDRERILAADEILAKLEKVEESIAMRQRDLAAVKSRLRELEHWLDLPVAPGKMKVSDSMALLIGTLPIKEMEAVDEALKGIQPPSWEIFTLPTDHALQPAALMVHREAVQDVQEILAEHEFQAFETEYHDLSPAEEVLKQESRQADREEQLKYLRLEAEGFLSELNTLKIAHDFHLFAGERDAASAKVVSTNWTFVISGWARREDIPVLKEALAGLSPALEAVDTPPGPEDDPPVDLRNNRLFTPFELITGLYSTPRPREDDPTPHMAPFFILFFGLCLTDGGYGAIMAAASLLALRKVFTGKGGRQALGLFFICGLSTLVAGVVTGGWFGDLTTYLPGSLSFLDALRRKLTLFDPIKEPLIFMGLSLTVGFIQIWYGLGVRMVVNLREKRPAEAFLDQAPWMLILLGAFGYGLTNIGYFTRLETPSLLAMAGGASVTVLAHGRSQKNIFKRLGLGILKLYDLIGYASDVLSYSRLLALGLATAVIATVINQLAFMSLEIPYIGFIIMLFVLVAGHIFNLVINTLGAFVHTCRLQFVEFFPKFYGGGGRSFRPFGIKGKYTRIE